MLAIYDRFGRLQYGNENVIRDILEYVVFEKYITRMYTDWRIHGKVRARLHQALASTLRQFRDDTCDSVLIEISGIA